MPSSPQPLTPAQQRRGRKYFLWFARLNGVALPCQAEQVLVLYALAIGMNEALVGLLGSLMFATMPMALLGRTLVARIGLARTFGLAWALRNVSALVMIAAPLAGALFGTAAAVAVVFLGAAGFCCMRSVGTVANGPLLAEVCREADRGRFASRVTLQVTSMILVTLGMLTLAMRLWPSVGTYQGILAFGAMFGFASAYALSRIPEGPAGRHSARVPLREAWGQVRGRPELRILVLAQAGVFAGLILVVPVSLAAVKRGYDVPDGLAIVLALLQVLGSTLMSLANGVIADRTGPRPLAVIYGLCLFAVCALWLVAPATLHWPFVAVVLILSGVAYGGTQLALLHYYLSVTEPEHRVGVTLFTFGAAGLVGGLLGSALSGGTISLLRSIGWEGVGMYRIYFAVCALCLVPMLVALYRLRPSGDWRVRDVLGLLTSPRDLRAVLALSRFERGGDVAHDAARVEQLGRLGSDHSREALLGLLESPKFSIRAEAIEALRRARLDEQTTAALIAQLRDGEYTTAYLAAEVLGEHHARAARDALRQALDSPDLFLSGKAMVALARLGDADSLGRIERIFRETDNPRLAIHGAWALAEAARPQMLRALLAKALDASLNEPVRREVLYFAAELAGCGGRFYRFAKLWRDSPAEALDLLERPDGEKTPTPQAAKAAQPSPAVLMEVLQALVRAGEDPQAADRAHQKLSTLLAELPDVPRTDALRGFWTEVQPRQLSGDLAACIWHVARAIRRGDERIRPSSREADALKRHGVHRSMEGD